MSTASSHQPVTSMENSTAAPDTGHGLPPIIGYVTPLRGTPGETLEFKISSKANQDFSAQVVRIDCADPNPDGPGMKLVPVDLPLSTNKQPTSIDTPALFPGLEQHAHSGSCAVGPIPPLTNVVTGHLQAIGTQKLDAAPVGICLDLIARPTLETALPQTLFSIQDEKGALGIRLLLENTFLVVSTVSDSASYPSSISLPTGEWTRIRCTLRANDNRVGDIVLETQDAAHGVWTKGASQVQVPGAHALIKIDRSDDIALPTDDAAPSQKPIYFHDLSHICLAATWKGHPEAPFNGLLESPALFGPGTGKASDGTGTGSGTGQLLARWDFRPTLNIATIPNECSPAGSTETALTLVNMPARAQRGARWTGRHMDWKNAPDEYAAIHFHSDDLFDCAWATSIYLAIPEGTPSAVYGLQISNAAGSDTIPFFVTPARDTTQPTAQPTPQAKRAKIAYLASTLTYLAYANHARGNYAGALQERIAAWGAYPHHPDNFPMFGRSTYNEHPDGSGITISSHLRPILTMRPGYLTFPDARGSGMRHFPADSHLTDWLRVKGYEFDVITDEDLDDFGVEALKPYAVVITGSHPEYHTRRMLDALIEYQDGGGRFMYMGGNGFYWKIARPADAPYAMEIRRAEGGIRAWASEPGEYYNQFDGEYGGMWRRNGLPPQRVAGVGFAVQGNFEGSYYLRTAASFAPEFNWLFDGVKADASEPIGDYGLSGGGAAGFELDQKAVDLGSAPYLTVVAASAGHGPSFQTVPEEILTWTLPAGKQRAHPGIRAHMVYGEAPNGGALFAVGSITFLGSLSHNSYGNDISRILDNCLKRFSRPDSAD